MASKFVIADIGPLDRLPPGTDVTEHYPPGLLKRLIAEGYVEEVKPKTSKRKTAKSDEVSDGD